AFHPQVSVKYRRGERVGIPKWVKQNGRYEIRRSQPPQRQGTCIITLQAYIGTTREHGVAIEPPRLTRLWREEPFHGKHGADTVGQLLLAFQAPVRGCHPSPTYRPFALVASHRLVCSRPGIHQTVQLHIGLSVGS